MLAEFSALEARDPKRLQRVTQVIHHLLRHQFLHVENRGSPSMLETLLRPELERLVADYFEVAGYRLVVREIEGWAGILPDTDETRWPRMRMEETLVLLLMRRLWEEGIEKRDVEKYGSVITTLNEAYDAYQDMVAQARRPSLTIGDFKRLVQSLDRRAILMLGDYDNESDDMQLTIRALVATVTGDQFVAHLEQLLSGPDFHDNDDEPSAQDEDTAE